MRQAARVAQRWQVAEAERDFEMAMTEVDMIFGEDYEAYMKTVEARRASVPDIETPASASATASPSQPVPRFAMPSSLLTGAAGAGPCPLAAGAGACALADGGAAQPTAQFVAAR